MAEPEAEPEPVVKPLSLNLKKKGQPKEQGREKAKREKERAEMPQKQGQKEKREPNRPRVPSIEEVTDNELFGDIDEAEREPAEPSLRERANAIVAQKDFDGAAKLYTEALAVERTDSERVLLLSNLALCLLKLEDWAAAVDAASQALELEPNPPHRLSYTRR